MAIVTTTGTPFVGYVSLTTTTPTNFALFTVMGQAAYTLGANERCVITNVTLSSNDTAPALISVDTGGTTPTKIASAYLGVTLPPTVESIPPGCCHGIFGVVPRATAGGLTGGKTIECVIKGFISRTA